MKTLILRTIYHTNVWEVDRVFCNYETTQLLNMILVWQEDYFKLKVSDINYALGIYAPEYFRQSKYGNIPYSGNANEEIISIINPTSNDETGSFQRITGLEKEEPHTTLSYKVIGKLWEEPNKEKMHRIDNDLINAKINELIENGYSPQTDFKYPLSFVLDENIVSTILSKYKVNPPSAF